MTLDWIAVGRWAFREIQGMRIDKTDSTENAGRPGISWPAWARRLASIVILVHVAAVLAGAFAAPPSSKFEHEAADFFSPYHQALDQGDSYRYYSTAFPPTPVVTATLSFADGRPEQVIRIPERGLKPRLLYQRQLALAHGLMEDFEAAKHGNSGDGSKSRWAHSFATHLGKSNPGCNSVTLRLEMHIVPGLQQVAEMLEHGATPVDLDSEEFSTAPERIGVYPCDAS